MGKITVFVKRVFISCLKYVVFVILYTRLMILMARHRIVKLKRSPISLNHIYRYIRLSLFKILPDLRSAAFTWNLADRTIRTRMLILIIAFAAGFIVLSVRLVQIASKDIADQRRLFAQQNYGNRVDIVDRNGNLLAVNVPSASLFANPFKVIDPEGAVAKLKKVFPDIDTKKVLHDLKSTKSFVWIRRDISPKQQQDIFNLGMPGFEFENEQKRIYTYGRMLSHVIGYVGRDMEGLAGIERYCDDIRMQGVGDINGPLYGGSLHGDERIELSIDVRLQNILSEEIDATMAKFNAKGAAGIVVNPNTGEILALVSKPDFDPHFPGKSDRSALFNIATQGVYEMGSGIKALPMAIALDIGKVKMNDAYDLSYMKVSGFQVKDYHENKGWRSVAEIFMKSSNVGMSQIMLEVGKENLRQYFKKLRLLDKLELEVPECGRPLFQPFSRWTDLGLVTMSYGYAFSQTPAHFIQAMIPVVNGGVMYPLTLIKRNKFEIIEGERIFTESTSKNMLKMMRLVVSEGTGTKSEVPGYYIAGKTGTADKLVDGKYDKGHKGSKRMSSFLGVMPATNPRFLLYIVIDEPNGIKETYGFAGGGWTAAPTAGRIFERIATLYGMSKLDENDKEVKSLQNVPYKVNNEI